MYSQAENQSLSESLHLLESTVKACGEGTHEEKNHLSVNRVKIKAIRSPWKARAPLNSVLLLEKVKCGHAKTHTPTLIWIYTFPGVKHCHPENITDPYMCQAAPGQTDKLDTIYYTDINTQPNISH
ncbi:hypothetical protein llap_4098 [Limosa lapponica baueri]|uniref:Uncharacterized protein n=1 Tax=Limosa lapponica baueri TaxID=1758121 RepID=A0A2I0UHU3_LIMLA|nr:hypothetical protein llap_4098 [Limosa lapponica baueri]